MKTKNLLITIALLIATHKVNTATVAIENKSNRPLAIHPILNIKDEYVTKFKYSIQPEGNETYRSGIYPIKGFRWKKTLVNKDGKSFITVDYITTNFPGISVFNDYASIEIFQNDSYRYYYKKNDRTHYHEDFATLVASNLYQKIGDKFVLKNTGIAQIAPNKDLVGEWVFVSAQ